MANQTQGESALTLSNQATFLEFPRGSQVRLETRESTIMFGTVIGHQLNVIEEMILEISVIEVAGERTVLLHPSRAVRLSK